MNGKLLLWRLCNSCGKKWKDKRYSYNYGFKCSICKRYSCEDCITSISEKIMICHLCNGKQDKLWRDFNILYNRNKNIWSHKKMIYEMTKIAMIKKL